MLQSYFIAAIRNLRKNSVYAAINVTGLALGISCLIIIFVIVRYETSFDDYHSKADQIYRVNLQQKTPDGLQWYGNNYSPLTQAIRSEITGIEAVTGVYCLWVYQINKDDGIYEDKFAFFADQQYFDVFDVKWISGNPGMALSLPNTVVVTDQFAERFLGGKDNALGNTFLLENKVNLTVTGVVQAPPSNTDHPYTMLISYPTLAEFNPGSVDNWKTIEAGATYVVVNDNTRLDQIDTQLKRIGDKYLETELANNSQFHLLPLDDNHDRNYDYSSFNYDFPLPVMILLSIVAGMIAFIACINFVNLATAQSINRAREVGIRKTLGSSRSQLILQYISEAFVITLLAVITGGVLAKVGMNQLNAQYGSHHLRFDWQLPSTILFLGGVTTLITILAGFYPAFVLSKYKPVSVLKAQQNAGNPKGLSLRRGLVLVQFAGAQLLILVTLIIINQINHFKERPLGFDPEAIVVLPYLLGNETQQHSKLDYELSKVPGITSYTFASGPPIGAQGQFSEFYLEDGSKSRHRGLIYYSDGAYLNTFDLQLVVGKNFPQDQPLVSADVLVNETLVKTLGIDNPEEAIGVIYNIAGKQVRIRGVIKDFYNQSMSSRIDPITMQFDPEKNTGVVMKISRDNISETLASIENAWKAVYPNFLCRYRFMDELLDRQYGAFKTIFTILGLASFLAIFIGCLGLYGLISFMALQRTKEIGIRKVLGATVSAIMKMFAKESVVLIFIAFMVAAPLAYFLGMAMLMELPERTQPGAGVFLLTLTVSLFIAGTTVGYRSFSAATQNPVDSLRNE